MGLPAEIMTMYWNNIENQILLMNQMQPAAQRDMWDWQLTQP